MRRREKKGGRTPILGPNYSACSRRIQKKAFILVSLAPPPPTLFSFFLFFWGGGHFLVLLKNMCHQDPSLYLKLTHFAFFISSPPMMYQGGIKIQVQLCSLKNKIERSF